MSIRRTPVRYGPVPSLHGTVPAVITLWPAGTITVDRAVMDADGVREMIRLLQQALRDALSQSPEEDTQ
jgi:hypothetical protein